MGITTTCPSCSRRYSAPDSMAGKTVKCRTCGGMIVLPTNDEAQGIGFATEDDDAYLQTALDDTPLAMTPPKESDGADDTAIGMTDTASVPTKSPKSQRSGEPREIGSETTVAGLGELASSTSPAPAESATVTYTPPPSPWTEWYRHPYALKLDYWLPKAIVTLGVIWLVISMVSTTDSPPIWIVASRLGVLVVSYLALVFPLCLVGLKIGAGIQHEAMPRDALWRTFASYVPALTISVVVWNAGNGTTPALAMGALLGLAISAAVVMVLFRLEPEKVLSVSVCGSGGFVIGGLAACLLVYGLNYLTMYGMSQSKMTHPPPPVSPYWPGLSWNITHDAGAVAPVTPDRPSASPPKSDVPIATKPETVNEPPPVDPGIVDLTMSKLVERIDPVGPKGSFIGLLHPSGAGNYVVVFRKGQSDLTLADRYDTQTWTLVDTTKISESIDADAIEHKCALSSDGKWLARIASFPRDCIQVWSFEEKRVETIIPIDKASSTKLIGFDVNGKLVVLTTDPAHKLHWFDFSDRSRDSETSLEVDQFGSGYSVALDPTGSRVAVACEYDHKNEILIYQPGGVKVGSVSEGSRHLWVDAMSDTARPPSGLAFSPDGTQLAAYYEKNNGGFLAVFKPGEGSGIGSPANQCIFDHVPTPTLSEGSFQGSSLTWFAERNCWLLYGDAVVENVPRGRVVGNLGISDVKSQRIEPDDTVELVRVDGDKKQLLRVRVKSQ